MNNKEANIVGYFCLQVISAARKAEKGRLSKGRFVELYMNKDSYRSNYYQNTNVTRHYQRTIYGSPLVWFSKGFSEKDAPQYLDGVVSKITKDYVTLKDSKSWTY